LRSTSLAVAITLLVLAALTTTPTAAAQATAPDAPASASWHGRAIQDPDPRPPRIRAVWPRGWSAGAVGRGTGYLRPGGSRRVRDVQRRLTRLGYRPGPIDGLFGPRTQAAVRWFQYKHALPTTGRVGRQAITVLYARSQNRPRQPADTGSETKPPATSNTNPKATTTPGAGAGRAEDTGGGAPIAIFVIALAVALLAGLLVGTRLPRRRREVPVVGYAAAAEDLPETAAALERACARGHWTLTRIVQETRPSGARLVERPGLLHALDDVENGRASGIVVTRIREVSARLDDLAVLLQWLGAADGFLASADDDLDTSTDDGRAAATALIDIAGWKRRYTSEPARTWPAVEPRIAALKGRGLPDTTIADVLNLAGIPAPGSRSQWAPADVDAASRRADEAHS
jgi:peptidoglycan hydrolase-like protein with peptidoglycan-binding domain